MINQIDQHQNLSTNKKNNMSLETIYRKILGIIGGSIVGSIISIIIHTKFLDGFILLPISLVIKQLFPGIILGGIFGYYFHNIFFRITEVIIDQFD